MKKFEIGKTYICRSIGDYDCIFEMTVTGRTAKTISAHVEHFGDYKFRVNDHFNEGIEHVDFGRYSMHPIFDAAHVR